ncbi:hypothetical protein [Streptomyces sp. NPDC004284]
MTPTDCPLVAPLKGLGHGPKPAGGSRPVRATRAGSVPQVARPARCADA